MTWVWVFQAAGGRFVSGVFCSRELAEAWIQEHGLSGILTKYPVDIGVYDWAVENGHFEPKRDDQRSSEFKGRFSSSYLEHYHYDANG